MIYDAIIIGKGPAGISAALYTIRSNMKTLVIGMDISSLAKAEKIENYYGFAKPVSGKLLLEEGEAQVKNIGGEILVEEVVGIEKEDIFIVKTTKNTYKAISVLIAAGQKPAGVKIRGIKKFEGKGVSYCTTCDGFFYRGKNVGVLGYKNYALLEANELVNFTDKITIFTNGVKPEFSSEVEHLIPKFNFINTPIHELEGTEVIEQVVFEDGTKLPIDGMFIAYDSASSISFALKMGILTQEQAIVTNTNQETNIEGLYAAGDCTGVFKQVSVAVGQGAIAGKHMAEYIRAKKKSELV